MTRFQKFEYITIVVAVALISFFGGHYMGKMGFDYELKNNPPKVEFLNKRPSDQSVDFNQFWEVYTTLNNKYLQLLKDNLYNVNLNL